MAKMMVLLVLLLVGLAGSAQAAQQAVGLHQPAPRPQCVFVPVDLALLPDYSLNALYVPCGRNLLGLSLLASKAGELNGLQLAVGANAVHYDAWGVQLAGFANIAGENLYGLQLGGLISVAGRGAFGLQVGGLMSVAGRDLWGIQVGGLMSVAGQQGRGIQVGGLMSVAGEDMRGIQVGGLMSAAGQQMWGIQVGGLMSVAGEQMNGLQIGGLMSASPGLRGVQLAGGMNAIVSGDGLQLAGGLNRATGHLDGVQIAVVNIGCDVSGMQIGVVNVAGRVHGLQLGVVNVADHADAPIGLVSWMREGEHAVEVWGGEAVPVAAGARLGTRRVYSLLGFGGDPARNDRPWGPVGGVGVLAWRPPGGRVAVGVDALAYQLFFRGVDDRALLAQARVRALIDVTPRLALTVGATWNVFVSEEVDGAGLPLGGDRVSQHGATLVRQWPGVTAGVAIGF